MQNAATAPKRIGRPANPRVTAAVIETIKATIATEGFWAATAIAAALSWTPAQVEWHGKYHRRLKKLRREAEAALEARLGDELVRKALAGDRGALVMALKKRGWSGSRDPGGAQRPPESAVSALFADLEPAAR